MVSQGAVPHPRSSLMGLGSCVSLNVLLCRRRPRVLGSRGLAEGKHLVCQLLVPFPLKHSHRL